MRPAAPRDSSSPLPLAPSHRVSSSTLSVPVPGLEPGSPYSDRSPPGAATGAREGRVGGAIGNGWKPPGNQLTVREPGSCSALATGPGKRKCKFWTISCILNAEGVRRLAAPTGTLSERRSSACRWAAADERGGSRRRNGAPPLLDPVLRGPAGERIAVKRQILRWSAPSRIGSVWYVSTSHEHAP